MKTRNGTTLNRMFRNAETAANHLKKLKTNCSPLLNRLAAVAILVGNLKPRADGANRLTIAHRGNEKETGRIADVLGITVADIEAGKPVNVQFSRITVAVTFKVDAAAVDATMTISDRVADEVQRRAAA